MVKVSSKNLKKWNALHFAIRQNNAYAISLMLEGEPRRESDMKNFSETEVRHWNHNPWVIDALLSMDDVTKRGWNVLHIAAMYWKAEILFYLVQNIKKRHLIVEHDASCLSLQQIIETPCSCKFTPLLTSIKYDKIDIAKILVKNDCNLYAVNNMD